MPDPIDHFFDATNVNVDAQILGVDDCLMLMLNFITLYAGSFITDSMSHIIDLKRIYHPQAEIASQLPLRLPYFDPKQTNMLSVITLYDLVVLIGRCISHGHFDIPPLKAKLNVEQMILLRWNLQRVVDAKRN